MSLLLSRPIINNSNWSLKKLFLHKSTLYLKLVLSNLSMHFNCIQGYTETRKVGCSKLEHEMVKLFTNEWLSRARKNSVISTDCHGFRLRPTSHTIFLHTIFLRKDIATKIYCYKKILLQKDIATKRYCYKKILQ